MIVIYNFLNMLKINLSFCDLKLIYVVYDDVVIEYR